MMRLSSTPICTPEDLEAAAGLLRRLSSGAVEPAGATLGTPGTGVLLALGILRQPRRVDRRAPGFGPTPRIRVADVTQAVLWRWLADSGREVVNRREVVRQWPGVQQPAVRAAFAALVADGRLSRVLRPGVMGRPRADYAIARPGWPVPPAGEGQR